MIAATLFTPAPGHLNLAKKASKKRPARPSASQAKPNAAKASDTKPQPTPPVHPEPKTTSTHPEELHPAPKANEE